MIPAMVISLWFVVWQPEKKKEIEEYIMLSPERLGIDVVDENLVWGFASGTYIDIDDARWYHESKRGSSV